MFILNFVFKSKKIQMHKILRLPFIVEGYLYCCFLFHANQKYIFNDPIYVKHIGMAHGVLLYTTL
jgi:hypothetical protein